MKICGAIKGRYRGLILHIQDSTTPTSVVDTLEVVRQLLDDHDGFRLLDRSDVFGNQDGLLRFDENASVSLFSSISVGRRVSA